MKKIKSILMIVLCLFFVSCEGLVSLLGSEEDLVNQDDLIDDQINDNFYFNGTVYSDSYDLFGHLSNSHSGLIDVDFEYPTSYTGSGAEGQKCIRADFSQQGDFGVFLFHTLVEAIDLTNYNSIKFLAKADADVDIQIGLDSAGGAWNEQNSGVTSTRWVGLSTEWTLYTINLTDLVDWSYTGGADFIDAEFDLSQVTSIFKVDGISDAYVPFYIDHIYFSGDIVTDLPDDNPIGDNSYTYQIEWDQLSDDYVNSVRVVDVNGDDIMSAAGAMQLGQVTSTPVSDSYFGVGNALNYVHDGINSWGGVFFNGIEFNNNLTGGAEFKVAIKGDIPPELTCWSLKVEGGNGSNQEVNFMEYEVESDDPDWRLFIVPASEYYYVELDAFFGLGLWNPKQGNDVTFEGGYVGCDLIIDVAIKSDEIVNPLPIPTPGTNSGNEYIYQVEWDQLSSSDYVNSVYIINTNGEEVMIAEGSMQLGQVTSTPVSDSFFGFGNALNYVHDGVDSWGGVFFNGVTSNNDLTAVTEFKVAVKGDIPPELTCWSLKVEGGNGSNQEVNFLEYEVESDDPDWRLFIVPASEYYYVELDAFFGLGLWNPKQGNDVTFEGGYVGCDLIIDLAINGVDTLNPIIVPEPEPEPEPGISIDDDYLYQIEWGQLTADYENNVSILDINRDEVMFAAGSMQLGQVTSSPVPYSYFGDGNALNYVHDGVDSWGGVFFNGVSSNNNFTGVTEFKVAIKGDIPIELTSWEFKIEGGNGSNQGLNLMEYEVSSAVPEWRLFIVPASEFYMVELDAFNGLGLWNPKQGYDITFEGGYVGCDLIIDIAIKGVPVEDVTPEPEPEPEPTPGPSLDDDYTYQIVWGQLNDQYENNVIIVDYNDSEVMLAAGSMQLGQVTTTPVMDSYFGSGNALNYVHDGVDSWGGVFFNGVDSNNDLSGVTEFKVAIKGDIPAELTCWGLKFEDGYGQNQELNFLLYEVENEHPDWRLFVVPASEYDLINFDAFNGLGIWNPKQGLDLTSESGYVGCDLIIDLAIY